MAFLDDDEDIEHIVERWSDALQLGTALPRSAMQALQGMKSLGHIKDYIIVPDSTLPGAKGQFDPFRQVVLLRHTTARAAERFEPWALWTGFEELAHAALRHTGVRNFSETKTLGEKHSSVIKREEAEARRFAATMMAPYALVGFDDHMTAEQLSGMTGLPRQAAEYRTNELGRVRRRRTGKVRDLPPAVLDFLRKAPSRRLAFEGDPCPNQNCGKLTMVREGTGRRCVSCGTRTGVE